MVVAIRPATNRVKTLHYTALHCINNKCLSDNVDENSICHPFVATHKSTTITAIQYDAVATVSSFLFTLRSSAFVCWLAFLCAVDFAAIRKQCSDMNY